LKIVLDTNILISYCLGNENAIRIFDFISNSDTQIFADSRLIHEYNIIPKRKKFNFGDDMLEKLNNFIENKIQLIKMNAGQIKFNPDRQDSKLIEIANLMNCDYLITDDKPILRNANHLTKAKIINSEEFYKLICG
jgi:putative PIN family toxin of toxin-antitoxin system